VRGAPERCPRRREDTEAATPRPRSAAAAIVVPFERGVSWPIVVVEDVLEACAAGEDRKCCCGADVNAVAHPNVAAARTGFKAMASNAKRPRQRSYGDRHTVAAKAHLELQPK